MTLQTPPPPSPLWKQYLATSFFWGIISGLALFFGSLQRLFPALMEAVPGLGNPLLSKIGSALLLFGAAFPLLFALWLRRFSALRDEGQAESSVAFLWELALPLWNGALLWGGIGGFWGEITDRPGLLWTYPVYSFFFLSTLLFLLASLASVPPALRKGRSPAFLALFLGLWAFLFLLAYTALTPLSPRFLSESVWQTILLLSLLLPSIGLLLPLSNDALLPSDRSAWRGFLLVFLLGSPFLGLLFSSSATSFDLSLLFAFLLLPFAGRFLFVLGLWWERPHVWFQSLSPQTSLPSFPQSGRSFYLRLGFDPQAPSRSFLLSGLFFFALALLEIAAFASLRLRGSFPSPSWQASQEVLLLGASAFWLLGLFLAYEPPPPSRLSSLRLSWWLGNLGILGLFVGIALEGVFFFFLASTSIPRDTLSVPFAYFFQILGSLAIFAAFLGFIRPFVTEIGRLRPPPPPQGV